MDTSTKASGNIRDVCGTLLALCIVIMCNSCNDNVYSTIPTLALDIHADDIPDGNKHNTTLGVFQCGVTLASCISMKPEVVLPVGIEIRGHLSSTVDKKNYSIEIRNVHGFDRDYPLLGMPAESDWVLFAGGLDPSMLTNSVTFEIYRSIFNRYAPRTRYVNLYLQNEYRGLYVLMESIKVGDDRVVMRKLTPNDRFGVAVTGGYIFALDKLSDDDVVVTTDKGTSFKIHTPNRDDIVSEQIEYIMDYLNDVESAISAATTLTELAQWVDIDSLIDYILIHELTYNRDSFVFSNYFYKRYDDQKIYFGPVWDFDLSYGNYNHADRDLHTQQLLIVHSQTEQFDKPPVIWQLLWQHSFVRQAVAERWRALRSDSISIEILNDYFDEQVALMMRMQYHDFARWDRAARNRKISVFTPSSYTHAIAYMLVFLEQQIKWLDECFSIENERNYCS